MHKMKLLRQNYLLHTIVIQLTSISSKSRHFDVKSFIIRKYFLSLDEYNILHLESTQTIQAIFRSNRLKIHIFKVFRVLISFNVFGLAAPLIYRSQNEN